MGFEVLESSASFRQARVRTELGVFKLDFGKDFALIVREFLRFKNAAPTTANILEAIREYKEAKANEVVDDV